MKFAWLLATLMLPVISLMAQPKNDFTPPLLSVESYIDFTSEGRQWAIWSTFDHKKISVEARYGYDWEKNISVYAGPLLRYRNWKFRFLSGVTFGNETGISFSPTAILDAEKFYVFNQPQYIIGLNKMPSNFSHWGEYYYKLFNSAWIGFTDRFYSDKTTRDFAIGPQLLVTYKNVYIAFYWWIPSTHTISYSFLAGGYQHEF